MFKKYKEKYSIDEYGNLRNDITNKLLTKYKNKSGYFRYDISINGKRKVVHPHRAVAELFIPNTNNLPQVNHIDGNKTNNYISNLEWVTNRENILHASKNNLLNIVNKKSVIQKDLQGNFISEFESILSAAKYINGNVSHIISCCKGKRKTHKRYKWEYNK